MIFGLWFVCVWIGVVAVVNMKLFFRFGWFVICSIILCGLILRIRLIWLVILILIIFLFFWLSVVLWLFFLVLWNWIFVWLSVFCWFRLIRVMLICNVKLLVLLSVVFGRKIVVCWISWLMWLVEVFFNVCCFRLCILG